MWWNVKSTFPNYFLMEASHWNVGGAVLLSLYFNKSLKFEIWDVPCPLALTSRNGNIIPYDSSSSSNFSLRECTICEFVN